MRRTFLLFTWLVLLVARGTEAQVAISWPPSNTVFQRSATGTTTLRLVVCATGAWPLRAVQVRLARYDTKESNPARAADVGWQAATITAGAGTHRVTCQVEAVPGGLYAVQVWANDSLSREVTIGVGEVFAIAGQSNASGAINCGELPTRYPRFVQFFNARTACFEHDPGGRAWPGGSTGCSGPTKEFRFYWGALGDLFAERLGVPVVFHQTAYAGSQVDDWDRSSQGQVTRFGPAVPYRSLNTVLTGVVQQTGLRAVLWHQGESDQLTPNYDAALNRVIGKTWADAGFSVPWVVARASYYAGDTSLALLRQQTRVIGYANHANLDSTASVKPYGDPFPGPFGRIGVFTGPFTDSLGAAFRCDNVHFGKTGQDRVAELWFDALTRSYAVPGQDSSGTFLTNSLPLLPRSMPEGVSCPSPCASMPPSGSGPAAVVAWIRYFLACQTLRGTWQADSPDSAQGLVRAAGASNETEVGQASIAPNPSAERVSVRLTLARAGTVRLRVVNANGLVLADGHREGQVGENRFELNLQAYPTGLYGVQVTAPNQSTRTFRLVKADR